MTLVINCLIEIHQTLKGILFMWDEHDFPKSNTHCMIVLTNHFLGHTVKDTIIGL
jgi:hypothetical protein